MSKRRVYVVDGYRRGGSGWRRAASLQFASVTRARETSRSAARHGGAIIYVQMGEPEYDAWDDPEFVERHGELPPEPN